VRFGEHGKIPVSANTQRHTETGVADGTKQNECIRGYATSQPPGGPDVGHANCQFASRRLEMDRPTSECALESAGHL
jgi:hypothetical protein